MISFRSFTFNVSIWLYVYLPLTFQNEVKSIFSINYAEIYNNNNNETIPQEEKMNVDGVNINYLRVGSGEHVVLLLPGVMGNMWMHFGPQIMGLSKKKFTIVAWDPPGYGKSRPPDRTFPLNYFEQDATWARNLMIALGYEKFSLVGWSAGGTVAIILAAMYPENVRKLIPVAANCYASAQEMEELDSIRDIDNWPNFLWDQVRQPLIDYYGEKYVRKTWADFVDANENIYNKRNGSFCKEFLPDIRCPTLILQGSNDNGIRPEHSVYLRDHIAGAQMEIIKNGGYPVQLLRPNKFNSAVTKFLQH